MMWLSLHPLGNGAYVLPPPGRWTSYEDGGGRAILPCPNLFLLIPVLSSLLRRQINIVFSRICVDALRTTVGFVWI